MSTPVRIYVAGPMRGYPEDNVPQFRAVTAELRSRGFDVVSPVEIADVWAGGDQSAYAPEEYVRRDLLGLLTCSAIALLPGWERSTGARCEAVVARTLGLTFYDADGRSIEPPSSIVCNGGYERPPGEAVPEREAPPAVGSIAGAVRLAPGEVRIAHE